ncbi:MAG TPA: hypothetical protein VFF91_05130 [Pseudoxanthomonas sp.]|nr:hypothetical protein [Pseudoxanthomonas sp.]
MNILRLLVLVAFLVAGLVVGSLNSQRILIDFGVAEVVTTSGIALVVALLAGVLLGGGLVVATTVIPLQARLRRAQRAATDATPTTAPPPGHGQGT